MEYRKEKLKIKFEGVDSFDSNYSQAGQDLFVLMSLNGKKNGYFLDLGCHHPTLISNTYLLETKFGWDGVCMDIDGGFISQFSGVRKAKAYIQDATKIDFDSLLKEYPTNHIDYLSLDLEPADVTLNCLKSIPFDKIEFSVITFEHDTYRFGDYCKDTSREIFENAGYQLVCGDVSNDGCSFEDWYINPKYISMEHVNSLHANKKEWSNIIYE